MPKRPRRVVVYLSSQIYHEFKMRCVEYDDKMAPVLLDAVKEYIRSHPRKPVLVD